MDDHLLHIFRPLPPQVPTISLTNKPPRPIPLYPSTRLPPRQRRLLLHSLFRDNSRSPLLLLYICSPRRRPRRSRRRRNLNLHFLGPLLPHYLLLMPRYLEYGNTRSSSLHHKIELQQRTLVHALVHQAIYLPVSIRVLHFDLLDRVFETPCAGFAVELLLGEGGAYFARVEEQDLGVTDIPIDVLCKPNWLLDALVDFEQESVGYDGLFF
jgi:hypothetical protein